MCSAFTPMDQQQAINVQQQMYPQLVPGVADISSGPMHYGYNPADYNLSSNVNYLNSNHLISPSYHYHMSQPGYGLAASPAYSYASSGQGASSYSSGSPRSSDSLYGPSPQQQSPVQTPSPPPSHPATLSSQQLHAAWSDWPLECPTGVTAPKWLVEVPRPERRRVARCGCPYCATGREVKNEKGQRVHVCSIAGCEKSYHKTSHLKAHIRTHMGVRPYPCTWESCRRRFSRSDELNRHMRIHLQRKTHLCQMCGKGFTRSDHLQKHRKTHENQKRKRTKKDQAAVAAANVSASEGSGDETTTTLAPPPPTSEINTYVPALQQQQQTQQSQQQQQHQYHQQFRQSNLANQQAQLDQYTIPQQQVMQLQFTCVTHPNNFYHY